MRVTPQLEQQLERLQTNPPPDREVLDVALPVGRLYCPLAAVDRIGCLAQELRLAISAEHRDLERIRRVSHWLSQQIRYLLEPLSLIEIDTERVEAQLRSTEPQRVQSASRYYELLVAPTGLRLQRYSAPRGEPRTPIDMQLTHEVFRRLIDDFVQAAEKLR